MGAWFAATLGGLLLAQDPGAEGASPEPAPPAEVVVADDEIVVWGERLERARGLLDRDLRALGYQIRRQRDGVSVYGRTGRDRWKPKVLVRDDGVVTFRDPVIVFSPPVVAAESSAASATAPGLPKDASGTPDRGDLALAFPVRIPSGRLQDQEKARVMEAIADELRLYRDAWAGVGEARLLAELPAALDRLWEQGVDPRTGAVLADPAARRAALLDLWATRADTPAGQAAREQIQLYLSEVVMASATPLTEAELARARELGLTLD